MSLTLPDHVVVALRVALEFAQDEVENRSSAGGSMSDYINEAQTVVDLVSAALGERPSARTIPTTCIETVGGDPATALRLPFQIKVF